MVYADTHKCCQEGKINLLYLLVTTGSNQNKYLRLVAAPYILRQRIVIDDPFTQEDVYVYGAEMIDCQ